MLCLTQPFTFGISNADHHVADLFIHAHVTRSASCLLQMLLLSKIRAVRDLIRSNLVFVPLGLAYLALLAQSWAPDTLSLMMPGSLGQAFTGSFNPQFFPKLEGIQVSAGDSCS